MLTSATISEGEVLDVTSATISEGAQQVLDVTSVTISEGEVLDAHLCDYI